MGWIITDFALGIINLALFISNMSSAAYIALIFSLVTTVVCFGCAIYMLWEELHY